MDSKIYRKARHKVRKKIRFYNHLKFFLIANIFLFLISTVLFYSLWYVQLTLVWGLGLLGHYVDVFGFPGNGLLSKDWETREIEKEAFLLRKKTKKRKELEAKAGEEDVDFDDSLDLRELRKNYDDADLV